MKKIIIDYLPCLHCGHMMSLDNPAHECSEIEYQWLIEQDEIIVMLPDGELYEYKK